MVERASPMDASRSTSQTQAGTPLELALETMRDAVALYDGSGHLLIANGLYRSMYRLPDDLVRPGTPFSTIVDHCHACGALTAEGAATSRTARSKAAANGQPTVFHLVMTDGRTYEIHDQPLPEGGWVSTHRDVTEYLRIEARIAYLATHDTLTGLLDLNAFRTLVTEKLAAGAGRRFAIARLNIVGFRRINETYGHAGGDSVLVELARRARTFGPDMTVARVGSDDFAVMMPVVGSLDAAVSRLDGLRRAVGRPYRIGRVDVTVPVGLGYALAPDHGESAATLMRRADAARRLSGEDAPGRAQGFEWSLERERELNLTLAHDILPGIDRQEFSLAFQPIVDVADGGCLGAEALLRWNHPTLGLIRPDRVIAVAEEFGHMADLGEWVLRRAAAAARRWPAGLTVSVNVSGMQMRSRGFGRLVRSVLTDTGLDPSRLILEVTESTVLSDRGVRALMDRIAASGVRFALDDFGTGFASLHYLLKYPFDRIKVDRSFVSGLRQRDDSKAIVQAVITMAHRLGKDVVVEGIEREEERQIIAGWGRVAGQGYMFGHPMSEAEFLQKVAPSAATAAPRGLEAGSPPPA
jgi:diguanylate cyclase (GGDEF)-like protein